MIKEWLDHRCWWMMSTMKISSSSSVACCWEGQGMGWGRFRVPSDLCGSLRGKCEKSCHQVQSLQGIVTSGGCGLPVRVKCSLDLGPWLCRSPSVQLAEVQDNFLSSEECEFLKAQVHFDVRGSGGSPKRCKGPKGPLEASTIQKPKKTG